MVMVEHEDDPVPLVSSASWWGTIADAPRGSGGFGYDPLFLPDGLDCSSAELPPAKKNQLSHRGQAVAGLMTLLAERYGHAQ